MSVEVADELPDKLIGEVLANRYQIERKLGEGAMGAVYRARHVKVGRPFAVKVLHARLLVDDKLLHRFEREAELAGRLHHPNVIGVVDVGETADGLRYMVMDFAEGPDLARLLAEAPMPAPRIIRLVRQLLEGLYHAHEAGLIHRDFKPENVIVEKDTHGDEVPRIVDFGIAILREGGDSSEGQGRLTTNGLVLGTPHYMAPEQAVNDPLDHRVDLFALGIVIYEMLSGKLPFDGHGAEVARANLILDPPPISERVPFLEVDPLLEAFAHRLLEKKRDRRPANAKAARDLLDLIASDRAAAAAALGVPVAATHVPRTTQPVQPRHVGDYPGTFPPPIREAQAPAMTSPVAETVPPPGREARIATDPADPLPFDSEVPARRSRMPFILAGLAVLAAGVIAVIALNAGGTKDDTPGSKIATVEPPKLEPEVKAIEPPPPAPIDATIAVVAPEPPPVVKPTSSKVASKPPGVRPPEAKPREVKPPEIAQPEVKKPEPPVDDVKAFTSEFVALGAALKAASSRSDIADLQMRYTRITFATAVQPANRAAARAELAAIRKDLAGRTK